MVGALISGCSRDETSAERLTTPEFSAAKQFSASDTMPFDAFELSQAEFEEMESKEASYYFSCLDGKGISRSAYIINGDYFPQEGSPYLPLWGGNFGLLELRHASQYGYHGAGGDPVNLATGFYIRTWRVRLSEVTGDEGPSDSSPVAAAYNECTAALPDDARPKVPQIEKVEADLIGRAMADARTVAAVKEWRSCMQERTGKVYDKVGDASLPFGLVTEIQSEEIETATADVACTRSSGWANVFYTILEDFEKQTINSDRDTFDAYYAALTRRAKAFASLVP